MFIKVLILKINKMNPKIELKRFTTLIQPKLLSKIKLISYFTNQKLNEVVNKSLEECCPISNPSATVVPLL